MIVMRFRKRGLALLVVGLAVSVGLAWGALASHNVDLEGANTVPCYCQESDCWCGAASAQMALEGYPGGVEHAYAQSFIWNRIQAHNVEAWCTDPAGMRGVLMELGGDPGVHWVIFSNPSAGAVMHDITYWMTVREYPTPVLVHAGGSYGSFDHWVVIVEFTTDINPTAGGTATLESIRIFDPWPPCSTASSGGVNAFVTGSTWYTTYWSVPGDYAVSQWHGTYVAVVEPPEVEGEVTAERQRVGPSRIGPGEAVQDAERWIDEMGIFEDPEFVALRTSVPFAPLLVNGNGQYGGAYYLVPFGIPLTDDALVAILVNAFTGEVQEIGAFLHPVTYLEQDEAIRIAKRDLCLCSETSLEASAELLTLPSSLVQSRYLPVWQVTFSYYLPRTDLRVEATVYVTHDGQVYYELPDPIPGD